jgi:hypothetical protein
MKKLALLASMVAIVGVTVVGVASAEGTPTIVASVTGFPCAIQDANGDFQITTNSSSKLLLNGKEILHCIGQGAGNGTVITLSGFLCGMVYTGLSDSPLNSNRISKSGELQLWCYGQASRGDAASPSGGPYGQIG